MCGRWYVDLMADDELKEYYAQLKNKNGIKIAGEVFPSDHVMVIAKNKNCNKSVFNMEWGYHIGRNLVFNARSETLFDKPLFNDGIINRRCVIPANHYYEWHKETKDKNVIKEENSNIMYFLGIYRFENNEPVCTIITKDATESMAPLHDRMPVIITKDEINDWLNDNNKIDFIINNSINKLIYSKVE